MKRAILRHWNFDDPINELVLNEFPNEGVYIIYADTICLYVGHSTQIRARLARFFYTNKIDKDRYMYPTFEKVLRNSKTKQIHVYPKQDILFEQKMIQQLKPYFNYQHVLMQDRHTIQWDDVGVNFHT